MTEIIGTSRELRDVSIERTAQALIIADEIMAIMEEYRLASRRRLHEHA